jgi:CRISPR-associated protein Cas1
MRVLQYKADKLPLRKIAQLEHLSYGMVTRLCERKPVDLERSPYSLRASTREHFESERYWRERLPAEHKRCSVITVGGGGSALRVKNGELSILEDGRECTYLPATHGFKAIIFEAFGGYLTIDALAWLNRNNINLIVLCDGEPVAVPANLAIYNVELRCRQYEASRKPLAIARQIVQQKIASGRIAGRLSPTDAAHFGRAAAKALNLKALHIVEANAAMRYFDEMKVELRHKPKLWPNAWSTWVTRLSPIGHLSPQYAVHPVNAMLNAAYTVAANQLTRTLAASGLDPACGFLHSQRDYRASLAYDALELVRAEIDTRMLSFINSRIWSRADFPVTHSGVVRLQPSLARIVAARATLAPPITEAVAAWISDAITGTNGARSRRAIGLAARARERARAHRLRSGKQHRGAGADTSREL